MAENTLASPAAKLGSIEEQSSISLRRLRQNPWVRELVREHRVSTEQLIQPLFVVQGLRTPEEVPGLSGVYRETTESLLRTVESDLEKGVRKFLLFGVPEAKAQTSFSGAYTAGQISEIKKRFGSDLFLAVDVCLCSYTTHGHCGVMAPEGDHLDNAASVEQLATLALEYAQAGADCVAPSDMMDGRIKAIRSKLNGHGDTAGTVLMSYSAKFHSKFYGPFRAAADSAPKENAGSSLKDRASYQIDPSRLQDAYLSSIRDVEEGADILMVKPGLPYLDVLAKLSAEIRRPWAVYQVSGEYAGIELLSQKGLIHGPQAHVEAWTAFVRAGASMIITYGARNAHEYLTSN